MEWFKFNQKSLLDQKQLNIDTELINQIEYFVESKYAIKWRRI